MYWFKEERALLPVLETDIVVSYSFIETLQNIQETLSTYIIDSWYIKALFENILFLKSSQNGDLCDSDFQKLIVESTNEWGISISDEGCKSTF